MEFYFRLVNHTVGEMIEFTTNCFDEAVNLWREHRWGADEGQLVARSNGVELVLDTWEGEEPEYVNDDWDDEEDFDEPDCDECGFNPYAGCYDWDC